jgi:hypothetical protein
MVQKVTNTKIGLQDPSVQRTVTRTVAQQAIIANGSPKLENLNRAIPTAVIPSTTAKASPSAVSLTTSANNVPSDTVTIYPSSGNVYLTAVDQTFRNTIVNQFGVSAIIAGNNISITSSNGDGTGNVTISAASGGPGGAYLANGNSWANIPVYSGNVLISANNKLWTFNTTGNLDLPGNVEIGTEIGLVSINIEGNPNVTTFSNAGITVSGNANITGNVNVGTSIHQHSDHDSLTYGSCTINLNEDYEGGAFTFFKGRNKIDLKQGDAIVFPADYFWVHEVATITKGTRYAFNCFLLKLLDDHCRSFSTLRSAIPRYENEVHYIGVKEIDQVEEYHTDSDEEIPFNYQ